MSFFHNYFHNIYPHHITFYFISIYIIIIFIIIIIVIIIWHSITFHIFVCFFSAFYSAILTKSLNVKAILGKLTIFSFTYDSYLAFPSLFKSRVLRVFFSCSWNLFHVMWWLTFSIIVRQLLIFCFQFRFNLQLSCGFWHVHLQIL